MLFERHIVGTLKKKFLTSPRLCLRKTLKKTSSWRNLNKLSVSQSDDEIVTQKPLQSLNNTDRSKSAEDLKTKQITCQPTIVLNRLLPDIASLSNHYHSSDEFLNFLTNSARVADEQEQTINAALSQITVLKELTLVNQQLLHVVEKCIPSEHLDDVFFGPDDVTLTIDDVTMRKISSSLEEHTRTVTELSDRTKCYLGNAALAESDLYRGQELKRNLVGMRRSLLEISELLKCHTWEHIMVWETLANISYNVNRVNYRYYRPSELWSKKSDAI